MRGLMMLTIAGLCWAGGAAGGEAAPGGRAPGAVGARFPAAGGNGANGGFGAAVDGGGGRGPAPARPDPLDAVLAGEADPNRPYLLDAERRAMESLRGHYGGSGALARRKASRVHDRVTIVVNDSVDATNTLNTDFSRDSSKDMALNDFFTIRRRNGQWEAAQLGETAAAAAGNALAKVPRFRSSSVSDHSADGQSNLSSNLSTELSGTVLEVLPNGHLVVEAQKTQVVSGETIRVIFTGRIDPADLDATSRIQDRYVMDRVVKIEGKGIFTDFNKRGLIPKLMDKINLF